MKKIIKILLVAIILFISSHVFAADINLTIRNGNSIIFSGAVPLPPSGNIELNSHSLNADSVLSIINSADISSFDFSISDLQYYDSFGSFYLKCITSSAGNDCDNWQYTVNDIYPEIGMDQKILSGTENVYVYFGPQNKIVLSSNEINTGNILTVTAQKYNYQNNTWETRTGVTIGLTQPDPNNPWTPIEIKTETVDLNGQATFSSIPSGLYSAGIKEDFYFPTEALTVTIPPPPPAGGGIIFDPPVQEKAKFNLQKAFEFLISQQQENGSFAEDLYTDWVAIALAQTTDFQSQKEKLIKYLKKLKTNDYQLTDYERHAMALMALGINPYDVSGENYVKKITDSFDGKQFGDINKDNDDIFALIVLQNLEFTEKEKMIKDDVAFVLNNQKKDGSWDESIDMTGASIEALSFLSQNEQVKNALTKAKEFLKQNQKDDGGFGNVSSTAWAIEGILALSEKPEDWIKNDNSPLDYLGINQDIDGGTKNDDKKSKLWETAYTVSALSGKSWNQIMQKFEEPKKEEIIIKETPVPKNEIIIKGSDLKKETPILKNKIISKKPDLKKETQNVENLVPQDTATVIRPAFISILSAFLRFLIPVLDKIL